MADRIRGDAVYYIPFLTNHSFFLTFLLTFHIFNEQANVLTRYDTLSSLRQAEDGPAYEKLSYCFSVFYL